MSKEFQYFDEDGSQQDALMHDEILDNKEADDYVKGLSILWAINLGIDPEVVRQMYG